MLKNVLISCSLILILAACSKPPFLYRPDIDQGNLFNPQVVKQIQVGMSKTQVHALLGNPLLQDPFHPELDNYIYSMRSGETSKTFQRSLTIRYNKQEQVVQIKETPLVTKERNR